MKKKNFLLLVINYNLNIELSETFNKIKELKEKLRENYTVIFWDNLPKENNFIKIEETLKDLEKFYYPSTKNETLANIYNYIIESYKEKYDYFILFDNDSEVTEEYFDELESITEIHDNISLILPKIIYENKIYSPQICYLNKLKKSKIYMKNEFGLKSSSNVLAVNSGMVISTNYLKKYNYKYDSKLKFYGTDTYFMDVYQNNNNQYYLMNYILKHDFSMGKNETIEKILWRYSDSLNGSSVLLRKQIGIGKLILFFKILKVGIMKSIQYKNLAFIFKIFKMLKNDM